MECLHISLDAQAVGTVVCPECGTRRVVNLHRQCPQVLALVGEKRATITCRCGAAFQALFDLRRHVRKTVQLPGVLVESQACTTLSPIVIFSLSVQGLGGVLTNSLPLQHGEIYTARFHLDDAERSLVYEPIIIRRLQGHMVGAEFYPPEQYHSALDFYVYGAHLLPPLRPRPQHARHLSNLHPRDEGILL
jgi:hypothetical protein